ESTLDVVDGKTLKVTSKIHLSGHPNNIGIGRDGRRVYVSIAAAPGGVDVIDTVTLQRVKTLPVKGAVHNTYVTPDGKYVVAGSIAGKNITVFDAQTDQVAWVLDFDLGIRPMAFERNPDGSTKRIFAQLSDLNGFAVVDFATHKEVTRIELPKLPAGKAPFTGGGNTSHRRAGSHGGWKSACREQQTQQCRLHVLVARFEAAGLGGRRESSRLGNAYTRQQVRVCG